jgi:magnesium chelatase subunit H
MPSASAWLRGQKAAEEILRQHKEANGGKYPETVAVTLWGLDAIKTRGESVAIVLALVGARPVKEGTGRVVRYDLIPLDELQRPRVDVLASLSGIFRDSFANIVDLLDDMFERAVEADEPVEMNFIKKHAKELIESGVKDRPAARLFSNP